MCYYVELRSVTTIYMGSYRWFGFKIPTWVSSKLKFYIIATCSLWFQCCCIHLTLDIMLLGLHRSVINWPKFRCGALALKTWFLICKDLFEIIFEAMEMKETLGNLAVQLQVKQKHNMSFLQFLLSIGGFHNFSHWP